MKILILSNHSMGLWKFRKELLQKLVTDGHEVYASLPSGEYIDRLEEIGCKYIKTGIDRRGTNPVKDIKLFFEYISIFKNVKPDIVLTYTIKPNVYGGIVSRLTKTPYIPNVTGLGKSATETGVIKRLIIILYKLAFKKAKCVFLQNEDNALFFENNGIELLKSNIIPGSGVNLEEHKFEEYPKDTNAIRFLYVSRIMKEKGIEELLSAAEIIKQRYKNIEFDVVGFCETDYTQKLGILQERGIINYHGFRDDIHSFIKKSHASILPSYYEGMSNILLETAASGRPVLASRVAGCSETFDEKVTGIGFEAGDIDSLVLAIESFINLTYEDKVRMGAAGRKKIEKEFNRQIVVDAYLEQIKT